MEDLIKKLDMFNPINSSSGAAASQPNQEFLDEISDKIDRTNELMDGLSKLRDDNKDILANVEKTCEPLAEVGEREVALSPEIEGILDVLNGVSSDLSAAEAEAIPKQADIVKLQKEIKALIGQEVEGRLKEGEATLTAVDQDLIDCNEQQNGGRKKLKHLREQIEKAQKNQGRRDLQLLEKLNEIQAETNPLDDIIGELDTKLNDQKRKKADAKKQIEDMMKGVSKFKPSQLDGMLASLEELKDKNCWISEKLQGADGKLDQKLQELEDLVANCDTKQELLQ